MYLHLGAGKTILLKNIVAIMNLESFTQYDDLFNRWNEAIFLSCETPKSLIITQIGKETVSYLSSISAITIQRRINAYTNIPDLIREDV